MNTLRKVRPAELEDWLRLRYFDARIDISSSGVHPYTLQEIRILTGLSVAELDDLAFRDSPSLGHERLREALLDRFGPGPRHSPMVTHGSTEAILLAVSALVSAGDELIVTSPCYQSLYALGEAIGAKLIRWPLDLCSQMPDLQHLRRLIGPRTRAVVVNFPHNPTGITLTADEYSELLSIVERYGSYLLWDSAFGQLVYDHPPLPDPSTVIDRCVSFGTFSKAYGLPGLRVGWCIAPESLLPDMVRARDYVTLNVSPLLEQIAVSVLEHSDAVLQPRLELACKNRQIIGEWLQANSDLVTGFLPGGGVTMFPRIASVPDTRPVCTYLAAERGVLTVPGDCFGHADRIRLGFGGPENELRAGLAELTDTIVQWDARH